MNVHVLFAHPVEDSYVAALHHNVVATLTTRGHRVDDCDLYADNFDPRLTRDERQAYHTVPANRTTVARYVDRLLAADALVLVYPVWNFGMPAILKGYFDRVFLPGVSFRIEDGQVVPCLHNIKRLSVVTTYGASRIRAALAGDPPRRFACRVLRALVHPAAPVSYLAHYDMNRSTDASRGHFLARTRKAMEWPS